MQENLHICRWDLVYVQTWSRTALNEGIVLLLDSSLQVRIGTINVFIKSRDALAKNTLHSKTSIYIKVRTQFHPYSVNSWGMNNTISVGPTNKQAQHYTLKLVSVADSQSRFPYRDRDSLTPIDRSRD